MDSGLLNVFHDDPFDGNYVKYDTDSQFWCGGTETLGLQLSETLHGILPIAPTEIVSTNIYSNSIYRDEDYSLESRHDSNTNSIIYEDYNEVPSVGMGNKLQLASDQSIEIIPVNPNDEYDSEFLDSSDDNDEEELAGNDEDTIHGVVAFDEMRSHSSSTFRSRTDSSSIADYESHSSDYDEENNEDANGELDFAIHNDSAELEAQLMNGLQYENDLRRPDDDVDALGIDLNASAFDLAAFITQDDHVLEPQPSLDKSEVLNQVIAPTTVSESDSDSDVIVDVETVENDDVNNELWDQPKEPQENNLEYKDNIKSDPSWSPNHQTPKSGKKEAKVAELKRPAETRKKKFGIGRGKNISMFRNGPKTPHKLEKSDIKCKSQQSINPPKEMKSKDQPTVVASPPKKEIEKIAIKQEISPEKIKMEKSDQKVQLPASKQPHTTVKNVQLIKHDTKSIKQELKEEEIDVKPQKSLEVVVSQPQIVPQKRKLNLEEYKRRRENPSLAPPQPLSTVKRGQSNDTPKTSKTESHIQNPSPSTSKPQIKCPINKPPPNAEVTSIVKSLKENQAAKRFVDPITEAKNKVLRMQELKKAQQIKIIDSTVSSKVGRVTKILPLKDIVKDTYKIKDEEENKVPAKGNTDYEEIIIVSTGCNTELTIPPAGYNSIQSRVGKNASRSLLKTSVLFANISNTIQKVRSNDSVKISSNSLIASIQDVVVKNSAPMPMQKIKKTETSSLTSEHGEDKVIMHLRKDRIRKQVYSLSTQTDLLPEFPALPLPLIDSVDSGCGHSQSRSRKRMRRKYRSRQCSYSSDEEYHSRSSSSRSKRSRRHRCSISSSYSESDERPKRNPRYSGSSSQSRDRSLSSTDVRRSRSRSHDRVHKKSRSRSKSSSRSRSKSTRGDANNKFMDRNVSIPAVEERRIVYVGRIAHDATKETLRRRFISYGPIKQISIHDREYGKTRFGFVTYERAEDAFRVIDSGSKDPTINMYDISFGGRRAFCKTSYADLDNAGINTYQSYVMPRPAPPPKEEDSFEALLLKVKAKLNANKPTANSKI